MTWQHLWCQSNVRVLMSIIIIIIIIFVILRYLIKNGEKVLVQSIWCYDYIIWMARHETESRIMAFHYKTFNISSIPKSLGCKTRSPSKSETVFSCPLIRLLHSNDKQLFLPLAIFLAMWHKTSARFLQYLNTLHLSMNKPVSLNRRITTVLWNNSHQVIYQTTVFTQYMDYCTQKKCQNICE